MLIRREGETDAELAERCEAHNIVIKARNAFFRAIGVKNPHSQKVYMVDTNTGQRTYIGDMQDPGHYIFTNWTVDARL